MESRKVIESECNGGNICLIYSNKFWPPRAITWNTTSAHEGLGTHDKIPFMSLTFEKKSLKPSCHIALLCFWTYRRRSWRSCSPCPPCPLVAPVLGHPDVALEQNETPHIHGSRWGKGLLFGKNKDTQWESLPVPKHSGRRIKITVHTSQNFTFVGKLELSIHEFKCKKFQDYTDWSLFSAYI